MSSGLESKILECVKHVDDFAGDYEALVMENRELKRKVDRLETERRELRRRVSDVSERVEAHLKVRA